MSGVAATGAWRLLGLLILLILIGAVPLLANGCLSSTPGAETLEATPRLTATAEIEKIRECSLEGILPELKVDLQPTPKEFTITAVPEGRFANRVQCLDGENVDGENEKYHINGECDRWGVTFWLSPKSPPTVTIGVNWAGNEFSQTVALVNNWTPLDESGCCAAGSRGVRAPAASWPA